jgi:adenylate cyclase
MTGGNLPHPTPGDGNAGQRVQEECRSCGSCLSPCPACGLPVSLTCRACPSCGAQTAWLCTACGAAMPGSYRFCGRCGAAGPARRNERDALPAREERRRVAILFADLSGSTELSHLLDAEQTYRLVGECIAGLCSVVSDAGGYVVKTLGDGLMALFGAPVAHGDDAVRAGRAALHMQAWMEGYARAAGSGHPPRLRLRVGINHGSVVAAGLSTGNRVTYDVLGDAVNVAQRIESAAAPGSVCVSESFYRLTRGWFEYRDSGLARVRGKPEPLPLFELVEERRQSAGGGFRFPLAGRRHELQVLREAARALEQGRGGMVALVGPGGAGKSRLLDELAAELDTAGVPILRGAAPAGTPGTAYSLWRTWLRERLPLSPGISAIEGEARLHAALEVSLAEWAPWLVALTLAPERLQRLTDSARHSVVKGALRAFLRYWRTGQPAALLVDEVHAVDQPSLQLLIELAQEDGAAPPLLVALAGRETGWLAPSGAHTLRLEPLGAAEASAWIRAALEGTELPTELVDGLIARSGGSPLFLELMLRAAQEAEDPLPVLSRVPDTLYGMVQSQLDSLEEHEHRSIQAAAVLGRQFEERWLEALVAADGNAASTFPWTLLERRGILEEAHPPPNRALAFRHGVLREVAYEGMLTAQRAAVHARAARVLEKDASLRPELAEQVGAHWEVAGNWAAAAPWLLRAAEWAAGVHHGAATEALFLRAADAAQRAGHPVPEARARLGAAEMLGYRGEYAAAEARLGALVQQLDALADCPPDLYAAALRRWARPPAVTGDFELAEERLDRALHGLATTPDDHAARERCRCLASSAQVLCDLARADEAVARSSEALQTAEAAGWEIEAAEASAALGRALWLRGAWSEAEPVLRRAAELAEAHADLHGAAASWINLGNGLQQAGEWAAAEKAFRRALDHAECLGDPEKAAVTTMDLGTLALNRGHWEVAEAVFADAMHRFEAMGHKLGVAACLYNRAECALWSGDPYGALVQLAEMEAPLAAAQSPFLRVHELALRAHALLRSRPRSGAGQVVEAARSAAARAAALAAECDYPLGSGLAAMALAAVAHAEGACERAIELLQGAVAGFVEGGAQLECARARVELAVALAVAGRTADAREQHVEAERTLRRLDALGWLAVASSKQPC